MQREILANIYVFTFFSLITSIRIILELNVQHELNVQITITRTQVKRISLLICLVCTMTNVD